MNLQTTLTETSDETATVTARHTWTQYELSSSEPTITFRKLLQDVVTIPPISSTSIGKSTPEQQDQQTQPNTSTVKPPDIVRQPPKRECTTLSCKRSASQMIAMMDHGADPCEDFFQYSCGGSVHNHIKGNTPDEELLKTLPGQFLIILKSELLPFNEMCSSFIYRA